MIQNFQITLQITFQSEDNNRLLVKTICPTIIFYVFHLFIYLFLLEMFAEAPSNLTVMGYAIKCCLTELLKL